MPTAFVGSARAVGTGASNSITLPTWTVGSNDWIYICAASDVDTDTFATPTGYTLIHGPTKATTGQAPVVYVWRKQAAGGDSAASVTISRTGSGAWSAQARVYSATTGTDASGIQGNGAAANNMPLPSLSPSNPNEMEVGFWAWYDSSGAGNGAFLAPAGWSNQDGQSPIQPPYISVHGMDSVNSGTTEVAGTATTSNATNNFSVGVRIALAPIVIPQSRTARVVRQAVTRAASW